MKIAKCSNGTIYECKQSWPDDCFVQCGAAGLVLRKDGSYKTAFFESFPKISDTLIKLNNIKQDEETFFLRGEGKDIEEAEKSAFNKFVKIKECAAVGHTFEKVRDSDGKCKNCNFIKSYVFEPDTACSECNKKGVFSKLGDTYYCFKHYISTIEKVSDDELFKLSQSSSEKSMIEQLLSAGVEEDEEKQDTISYYRNNSVMIKTLIKNNIIKLNKKEIDFYPTFDRLSNDFTWFYVSFTNKLIKESSIINKDSITLLDYITIKDKLMKEISVCSKLYTLIFEKFLFEKGIINDEIKKSDLDDALNLLKNNVDLK